MDDSNIIIKKISENVDQAKILQTVLEAMGDPEAQQMTAQMIVEISKQDAWIIREMVRLLGDLQRSTLQFFERRSAIYADALRWQKVWGFASSKKIARQADEIAWDQVGRATEMLQPAMEAFVANLLSMRTGLPSAFLKTIPQITAGSAADLKGIKHPADAGIENGHKKVDLNEILDAIKSCFGDKVKQGTAEKPKHKAGTFGSA